MYSQLDVHFDEHPNHAELELEHLGLMACAISYSNRVLTDGFVPTREVRSFGASGNGLEVAKRLVDDGIWEAVPGGYLIVGFLDHNPSRAEVQARVSTKMRAGKKGAEKRWETPLSTESRGPDPMAPAIALPCSKPIAPAIALPYANAMAAPTEMPCPTSDPDPLQIQIQTLSSPKAPDGRSADIQSVFMHWAKGALERGHVERLPRLTKGRRKMINARLNDRTAAELIAAIEALWRRQFHMDLGYTDLKYALRSEEQIELVMAKVERPSGVRLRTPVQQNKDGIASWDDQSHLEPQPKLEPGETRQSFEKRVAAWHERNMPAPPPEVAHG